MPNSNPSLKMTRPRAASLLSTASPFSLRHYQSDICSHSHDFAEQGGDELGGNEVGE